MEKFRIFTDATSDLTDIPMAGLPHVEIIPMRVEIVEREYVYGPGGDITVSQFYDLQKAGHFAKTAGINPQTYFEAFDPCLQNGQDTENDLL